MPIFNNILAGSSGQGDTGYDIDQSLRFEDGDSAKLDRTPSGAGNRKTWTWSCWVKHSTVASDYWENLFGAYTDANNYAYIVFEDDVLRFFDYQSGSAVASTSTSEPKYRDPSAWRHIVVTLDTTQATDTNRLKFYINGEQLTLPASVTYPSQNADGLINSAINHRIGGDINGEFDGYLAEMHFIDGTALDASSFGETNADTNQWVPIQYTGSYGTNGFYLDFSIGSGYTQFTSTGSNTWTCPAGVTSIDVLAVGGGGGGGRNSLQGGGGGAGGLVYAENYSVTPGVEYDITIGAGGAGTTGTATNGANGSDTVFNVNAEGGGATITAIGGGGGAGFHEGSNGGSGGGGQPGRNGGNATQGNSGGGTGYGNNGAAGYSGGGTDDHGGGGGGAGAAGTTAVTNKAGNGGIGRYYGYRFGDSVGDSGYFAGGGGGGTRQQASAIGIGGSGGGGNGQFNGEGNENGQANTGGGGGGGSANDSGGNGGSGTVILVPSSVSFIGSDSSGNGNNFTATNITATDKLLDSPTNNFATFFPTGVDPDSDKAISEGNLKSTFNSGSSGTAHSTLAINDGNKWYAEFLVLGTPASGEPVIGIDNNIGWSSGIGYNGSTTNDSIGYVATDGKIYKGGTLVDTESTFTTNDIIQVAFDGSTGRIYFGKNNTWQNSGDPAGGTGYVTTAALEASYIGFACGGHSTGSQAVVANFGQDDSFANNKTSGSAAASDANGIGTFFYTPPTGYLALCSDNLSDPSIANPTEYFSAVTWSGDGTSSRSITSGVDADWVWYKDRTGTESHSLYDSIRGAQKRLISNSTDIERTRSGGLQSFDSTGFTVGSDTECNGSGKNYVGWTWKAGGTASSNTDGSITSSVSANTDAGFSIVAWTGTGSNATVGHGLSQAPDLIINKSRDDAYNWAVQSILFNSASDTNLLYLNTTAAASDDTNVFQAAPTATVFSPQGGSWSGIGASGVDYIAYCFHSVDGYSKVGKYTGNSNADGPMFYCGFKPSWAMFKAMDSTQSWTVFDNKRNVYNLMDNSLFPDLSNAENDATSLSIDFVSNGIKIRSTHNYVNYSGSDYLVLAFAESPFKTSNAR